MPLDASATPPNATRRPQVIGAVMLSMFMVAIEATVVSTAMPQIVGELGGLDLYAWVFSTFLLTQTVGTVVFGTLSDVYGRKPTMIAGIALFLLGSLACGFAWSMPSMILFRLVQGVGAGAIQPIALTIVGDLYTAEERGKIQGFLASVWATSAILGPLVGALIVEHASWPWIFWMNLPIGLAAILVFRGNLFEAPRAKRPRFDVGGAALFTVAVVCLMLALNEAGRANAVALLAGLGFLAAGGLFLWQERRAAAPMVSLELWGRRPIAAANGASLTAGMALMGLTTFLPMYVQGVLRETPIIAGFALTVMVIGWPTGATLAARNIVRFGLRPILVAGAVLIPAGAALLLLLRPGMPPALAGAASLVMGFGMGLLSTASIVLIQEIVPWQERGSATASFVFARNLGSTLGAAIFGAVLNAGLARPGAAPVSSEELRTLLATQADMPGLAAARVLLQQALHGTFWALFLSAAATLAFVWWVPRVGLGRRAAPS